MLKFGPIFLRSQGWWAEKGSHGRGLHRTLVYDTDKSRTWLGIGENDTDLTRTWVGIGENAKVRAKVTSTKNSVETAPMTD